MHAHRRLPARAPALCKSHKKRHLASTAIARDAFDAARTALPTPASKRPRMHIRALPTCRRPAGRFGVAQVDLRKNCANFHRGLDPSCVLVRVHASTRNDVGNGVDATDHPWPSHSQPAHERGNAAPIFSLQTDFHGAATTRTTPAPPCLDADARNKKCRRGCPAGIFGTAAAKARPWRGLSGPRLPAARRSHPEPAVR